MKLSTGLTIGGAVAGSLIGKWIMDKREAKRLETRYVDMELVKDEPETEEETEE